MTEQKSPRNPYQSYLVNASAGSGKTYQLSRRFLFLVGAGAAPEEILTVTFTRKAASEMRGRILAEAMQLSVQGGARQAFESEMAAYFKGLSGANRPAAPRSAAATAAVILASSQALKITTIDAIFLNWVMKFPGESLEQNSAEPRAPEPFSLADQTVAEELEKSAWRAATRGLAVGANSDQDLAGSVRALVAALPDQSLLSAQRPVSALSTMRTALWYAEKMRREGTALASHPLPSIGDAPELAAALDTGDFDAVDFLSDAASRQIATALAAPLAVVAAALPNQDLRDAVLAAARSRDLKALAATPLMTEALTVSKGRLKGAKRDAVQSEINCIESLWSRFESVRRLAALNHQGIALYALNSAVRAAESALKEDRSLVTFSDLAECAFRLFQSPESGGARFLLNRTVRHLMLDEFQDTSRLQWSVFAQIAEELLAGAGIDDRQGLPGTVFIVGDPKQSIYSFREADPTVMDDAAKRLEGRASPFELTASFRTAQVALGFVNKVFAPDALANSGLLGLTFPTHVTATVPNAAGETRPVMPDIGRILVAPIVDGAPDEDEEELEDEAAETKTSTDDRPTAKVNEAALVATTLAAALSGAIPSPVYDKETRTFRPLAPRDCAVLYRTGKDGLIYEAALRARGIPCHKEEARGFFLRPEIKDAMALLRYLAVPADLPALLAVLRSPLGRLSDQRVLEALASTGEVPQDQRAAALLASLAPHAAGVIQTLNRAAKRTGTEPLNAILALALVALDARHAYGLVDEARSAAAGELGLAALNLDRLVELCLNAEQRHALAPAALVAHLSDLAGRDEIGLATPPGDSVALMTVHKAKGLEFPLVVVVDTGKAWAKNDGLWAPERLEDGTRVVRYVGRRKAERPLYDQGFNSRLAELERGAASEAARLLYVALTRARQYLIVTGHKQDRERSPVAGTTFHAHLSQALAAVPENGAAACEFTANGVRLTGWRSEADPGTVTVVIPPQPPTISLAQATDALAADAWRPGASDAWPENGFASKSLPYEWKLVAPSEVKGELAPAGSPQAIPGLALDEALPRAARRLLGDLIHAGLEAWLNRAPLGDDALAAFVLTHATSAELQAADLPDGWWRTAHAVAMARVEADSRWQAWRQNALRIKPECRIAYRTGSNLIHGSIDVLIEEAPGQFYVVDFKSTLFHADSWLSDTALKDFCLARGYDEQLGSYATWVRQMYPQATVGALAYFTSIGRFVALN